MLVERVINSGWTGSHRSTPTFEARGGVMRPTAPYPVTDIHLSWATFYTWSSRVILNIYRWTRYYRKPCFWYEMIKRRPAYTVTMRADSTDSYPPVLKHATPTLMTVKRLSGYTGEKTSFLTIHGFIPPCNEWCVFYSNERRVMYSWGIYKVLVISSLTTTSFGTL